MTTSYAAEYAENNQKHYDACTYTKAEDNPTSLLYAFALYDETGKLVSVDFKTEDVSKGLNVFERSLDYEKLFLSIQGEKNG